MQKYPDIFSYITAEEAAYKLPVNISDWDWSMADHIKTSFFYKHGRLLTGNSDNKPVKNIVRPILNLQYRTEDIDVKDIQLYVEDADMYHLSFLVKKYHDDVYLLENDLDSFIDEAKEENIDYGAVLVEKGKYPKPEVNHLQTIAFCDQTDILAGPICFKLFLSPDQLLDMEEKGWGKEENGADISLQDLLVLSEDQKKDQKGNTTKTPGKYVELYRLHGSLPANWLDENANPDKYVYQMQIVAFYQNEKNEKKGVCLFKKKDKKTRFKVFKRDPVYGRALGFGGVEELFEPQVWVNYDNIRMKDLLDAASKIILTSDDQSVAARHPSGLKNLKNLEIVTTADGKTIKQLDTFPRNINLFEKSIQEWEAHAQQTGAANDSIMGDNPNSGTPFKLQELVTSEAHGLHDYRQGKYAKFLEEVYRDWLIPDMIEKITQGKTFLSSLSLEEMQEVVDKVVNYETNQKIIEDTLNGKAINPQEIEIYKQEVRDGFMKDNKKFLTILKEELKDASVKIKINISGKQKRLSTMVDKLVNVFRQVMSSVNPQTGTSVLDDPRMAKIFNEILEYSGISPVDFGNKPKIQPAQPVQPMQMQPNQPINNQAL